jgi:glycerol uptake facilitator-like aquaporin
MSLSSKLRSRVLVQPEAQRAAAPKHRSIAFVELVTTAGLALSTAVAVTAVSIGIARADVLGAAAKGDSAPFAIALFIGLLFAAMGALTAIMAPARRRD